MLSFPGPKKGLLKSDNDNINIFHRLVKINRDIKIVINMLKHLISNMISKIKSFKFFSWRKVTFYQIPFCARVEGIFAYSRMVFL